MESEVARLRDFLGSEWLQDNTLDVCDRLLQEASDVYEAAETEESEDDRVDSDFDIDEEEASGMREDGEEEEPERKKKKTFIPKPKPARARVTPSTGREAHVAKPPPFQSEVADALEPRSFRRSTLVVSEEFRRRRQEEEERRRSYIPKVPKVERKLTQQEMLQEAKRTEIENIKSLEAFARLEAEKKKVKERKSVLQGPLIRFLSTSMPILSSEDGAALISPSEAHADNVEISVVDGDTSGTTVTVTTPTERYCRNFLIFTDTNSYPSAYFHTSKLRKRPRKQFCPITGLPAKYIDPLTGTPYATPQAFKIIRNRYVSEREQKCEKRLLQLSGWLEEKKKWLESKS